MAEIGPENDAAYSPRLGDRVRTKAHLTDDFCWDVEVHEILPEWLEGIVVSIDDWVYIIEVEALKMRSVPYHIKRSIDELAAGTPR